MSVWRPIDLVLAGASAVVAFRAFLPWVRASAGIFSFTKAGIEGDGVISLVAGLSVLGAVVASIYSSLSERHILFIALAGGIVISVVGVVDWTIYRTGRTSSVRQQRAPMSPPGQA
jgi:hypothetical protein